MNTSTNLQIPSVDSPAGPSRHYGSIPPSQASSITATASRPVSVSVHQATAQTPPSSAHSRRQQRASHTVVSASSHPQTSPQTSQDASTSFTTDVYSHPAAVAYAAAHPSRVIPKFGPYLLLQTLGEGEFGKVKLGLHCQWGEEVAVKLIRKGNVDTDVRKTKVEREIEVLKSLKHPNIVRLYDVIETDKYIGIILEYASGGELFDHILAHRYLRERDAAKLFSQLISGVWYIHQKKIVHRDLKLENLLLDRHRNVIITDFGFANKFEHRADDLMQTSCGSPCYAAPELVISEGLYVGSAVDIWSCGVILYAMLAGYLPFDDDPANPDGDNINLLYKYIVNTPLSFPDYISAEARDLLSMMLVPDPKRRASLEGVMRHPWLSAYPTPVRADAKPTAFGKSVEELERAALEQHQQKRLAYQRQMRATALANAANNPMASRTQSHRPEAHGMAPPTSHRSRSTQPEVMYDSSVDQSMMSPGDVNTTPTNSGKRTYGSPVALGLSDDDPFAAPGTSPANPASMATTTSGRQRISEEQSAQPDARGTASPKGHKSSASGGGGFRHTIQVEYDEPKSARRSDDRRRSGSQGQQQNGIYAPTPTSSHTRKSSQSGASNKPLPTSPFHSTAPTPVGSPSRTRDIPSTPKASHLPSNTTTPTKKATPPQGQDLSPSSVIDPPVVNISSPPDTPTAKDKDTDNQTPSSKGHKKTRSSVDKLVGKIFGQPMSPSENIHSPVNGSDQSSSRIPSDRQSNSSSLMLNPNGMEKDKNVKADNGQKSRRNTLTVMVEPLSRTIRNRSGKGRVATTPVTADGASAISEKSSKKQKVPQSALLPSTNGTSSTANDAPSFASNREMEGPGVAGMQASTSKAKKVMQWFWTRSKGQESSTGNSSDIEDDSRMEKGEYKKGFAISNTTVNQGPSIGNNRENDIAVPPVQVVITTPTSATSRPAASSPIAASGHPMRSPSTGTDTSFATPSLVTRMRNSLTVGQPSSSKRTQQEQLRIHHGAVDQTTITTRPPPEVMIHMKEVLIGMGVTVQHESKFKYRCVREKRKKPAAPSVGPNGPGLVPVSMSGTAASNGVDRRGLPLPSSFAGTGGRIRGLLSRRQSSQVAAGPGSSQPSLALDEDPSMITESSGVQVIYGDSSQDACDEVKFSVELTRIDRLKDTYSLDIRRIKGNLRSYKFLYDTLRQRADLQT